MRTHAAASLVEIIVAGFILASVFGGMLTTFVSVRTYVGRANRRQVATNLARGRFAVLNQDVRADVFDTGNLSTGVLHTAGAVAIDGLSYQTNWTSSAVAGRDYRQVTMNLTFPDIN